MIPKNDLMQNGFMSQFVRNFTAAQDWIRQHQSVNHNTTPVNGWVVDPHLWTRTGNYTFTISVDATGWLYPGVKVWYVDSTSKYGVVYTSSYSAGSGLTTITLITNSVHLMVANPTLAYYSISENPSGFPVSFNFTPSFTTSNGTGATGTWGYSTWSTHGRKIRVDQNLTVTGIGTSVAAFVISAMPVSIFSNSSIFGGGRENVATGQGIETAWFGGNSLNLWLTNNGATCVVGYGLYYSVETMF